MQSNMDGAVELVLLHELQEIEELLSADVMTIYGPIAGRIDLQVRGAVEKLRHDSKRTKLAVVLDTPGGAIELVEQMVRTLRHHYPELVFIVPDRAMSAGTVFVMAGDAIFMDYFSVLGPIDPQLIRDNKRVPALAYLSQYKRLIKKSQSGKLSTAEMVLLQKLDLAELQLYEEARELSRTLLTEWLVQFKFKDWTVSSTTGNAVTADYKKERARQIADALSDHEKWHSHGRGISMGVLTRDLRVRIDDLDGINCPGLGDAVRLYFQTLRDYLTRVGFEQFVHTRSYF